MPNTSTRIVLKKLKTDSSIRRVWLPKTLVYILRDWKKYQDELKLNHGDIKATQGNTGHAQTDMITEIYSHILDEYRKVNTQKFEAAFYVNPDLRKSVPPAPEAQKNSSDIDLNLLTDKLKQSPELAATLAQLLNQ